MKFLNSILVVLAWSETITVQNADELFKPTIDGTKCGNPKLGRSRRRKRQIQRNQQINERSWNSYQWHTPQRNYQPYNNYQYYNYNGQYNNNKNYGQYQHPYPIQIQNPYPNPYRYPSQHGSSYVTSYMTSTSTTSTPRPRPTRRPYNPYGAIRRPHTLPPRSTPPRPTRQSSQQVHQMIIPVNNGQFKSCTKDSFTMGHTDQPLLPPITVNSFYMPNYGAGKKGPLQFDPNKNYLGIIIMAIHSKGRWYTDHSKPFKTDTYNPYERKNYTASIKPGYILMNDGDYLERHYLNRNGVKQTYHAALLQDFTGKSLETLMREETFYIGWGFSYQAKNQRNGQLACDIIDNSTTFNAGSTSFDGGKTSVDILKIPGVGTIRAIANSQQGSARDTGVKEMIKLVVNAWRATDNREVQVSDILTWANGNGGVRNKIPKCP